jgi:hypothetical protein
MITIIIMGLPSSQGGIRYIGPTPSKLPALYTTIKKQTFVTYRRRLSMTNKFEKFGADGSSEVSFEIYVQTRNNRLTPDQRVALAHAVRNAARMVRVQMELACSEHATVSLSRKSSARGASLINLTEDDGDE